MVIEAADLTFGKRSGRQVLNLKPAESAVACVPAVGDRVLLLS